MKVAGVGFPSASPEPTPPPARSAHETAGPTRRDDADYGGGEREGISQFPGAVQKPSLFSSISSRRPVIMHDAEVIQVGAFRSDNPQNPTIRDFDVEIDLRLQFGQSQDLVEDVARPLPVICEFDVE